jgi:hypothetical protein
MNVERGQADAVNGDRVAVICSLSHNLRGDNDASVLAALLNATHATEFFNYSGEHFKPL